MDKIQKNEQWQLQGNCDKCRRNNYCSKPCTRYKKTARKQLEKIVAKKMDEMTNGGMIEIINKTSKLLRETKSE